jgi:Bacterial archaeo-eukaryotic release factor family 2
MPDTHVFPLLRLGRMELDQGLRAFKPGPAASDLVVTAMVEVPESGPELQDAWDVAWSDAAREAAKLGADQRTAQALAAGSGDPLAAGTRMFAGAVRAVVAVQGEVLLARWLPAGTGTNSVRVGPLPHLQELAAAAARRPAHIVVLAERHAAAIFVHAAADHHPARRVTVGAPPGEPRDPHPDRPPAHPHGRRHEGDSEPESGGERNAEHIAARVSEAAASAGAHIVLGAGDEHILAAVSGHLPGALGPITTIASGPVPTDSDDQLSARIGAALDGITGEAIAAVADLVASSAVGPAPAAARGIEAVAQQLAEQQVAVLLVAADISRDSTGASYRIGRRPTEFLVGDSAAGTQVPLEDGLVWAALHQDAIVVQLPDRSGPLGGQPTAALLRRR